MRGRVPNRCLTCTGSAKGSHCRNKEPRWRSSGRQGQTTDPKSPSDLIPFGVQGFHNRSHNRAHLLLGVGGIDCKYGIHVASSLELCAVQQEGTTRHLPFRMLPHAAERRRGCEKQQNGEKRVADRYTDTDTQTKTDRHTEEEIQREKLYPPTTGMQSLGTRNEEKARRTDTLSLKSKIVDRTGSRTT